MYTHHFSVFSHAGYYRLLTPLILLLLDSELVAPGAGGEAAGDSQGRSPHRCISPPPGMTLKLPEFKEHDFRTAPKFLTPLFDRVVVAGYAAALNCAVRGHPKVPCVCVCV